MLTARQYLILAILDSLPSSGSNGAMGYSTGKSIILVVVIIIIVGGLIGWRLMKKGN
jgi:hypothetical protein